jgi:hypothetical protein
MMTLDYHVRRMALDGTTPAGCQVIGLDVSHIQLGGSARITGATARVSGNGGKTWRAAMVTARGHGHFTITFSAPASTDVTLRVAGADSAGGSITETIRDAFRVRPDTAKATTPMRFPTAIPVGHVPGWRHRTLRLASVMACLLTSGGGLAVPALGPTPRPGVQRHIPGSTGVPVLVQCFDLGFGRPDGSRFTPLPGFPSPSSSGISGQDAAAW